MRGAVSFLKRSSPVLAVAFWVGLWWLAAALYKKPVVLPSPLDMLKALLALCKTGELYLSVALSLLRIVAGIAIALAAGTLLAILTVKSSLAHHLFSPILTLFKATPVASFIFLLLLWVGRSSIPALVAFMMALPIVWGNVREGLLQADPKLLEMARAFGVPQGRVMTGIRLPSLKPYFLAAARSVIALSWKAGIAAEVLCTPDHSIGRAIFEGKLYLLTEELFAWTFIVIVISILIERVALSLLNRAKGADAEAASEQKEVEA